VPPNERGPAPPAGDVKADVDKILVNLKTISVNYVNNPEPDDTKYAMSLETLMTDLLQAATYLPKEEGETAVIKVPNQYPMLGPLIDPIGVWQDNDLGLTYIPDTAADRGKLNAIATKLSMMDVE